MVDENMSNEIKYKIYLLESLIQDIDSKIDNPPMYYSEFSEGLKICHEYGIISHKHRRNDEND